MQLAYVLLRNPYFIYYNLTDKYFMQQTIWTDIKAIMFHYFPSSQYERDYLLWLLELDADGNTPDWAETSTPEIADETRSHLPITKTYGRNINFYNTLYWTQHVDKQMKDGILAKIHL